MKNIVKNQKRNKKIQENKCLTCIYREEDICIKRNINIYNKDNESCIYFEKKTENNPILYFLIGVVSYFVINLIFFKSKKG